MLKKLSFVFVTAGLFFLMIEGLCSTAEVVGRFVTDWRVVAERLHTRYDAELGWVSVPSIYIKDMYGPSVYLRTNSQGYRNNLDFHQHVPPGRLRVVCSGDSFTLGYGVDNDQTWCQLLESLDSRLQTINMGQGGYGVDQMYLWYRRDASRLDLDVHLLALIGTDFLRVHQKQFLGYGKPLLKLERDKLVTTNTPVPARSWATRVGAGLRSLRSVEVGQWLLRKALSQPPPSEYFFENHQTAEQRRVIVKILEAVRDLDRMKNAVCVLVYLPVMDDYDASQSSFAWRRWIADEASKRGIPVIDLLQDFQTLPREKMEQMFIHQTIGSYVASAGHYSVGGNRYVAERLYSKLISIPEVAGKLAQLY